MTDPIRLVDLPIAREFGAMLQASAALEDAHEARRRRSGPRRLIGGLRRLVGTPYRAVGAGAIIGLLAATVLVSTGHRSATVLDPVASASAALNPPGKIVHLVLRGGAVQPDGTPAALQVRDRGRVIGTIGRRIERWSTFNPFRLRIDTQVLAPDGRPLGVQESGQAADGSTWETESWNRTVRRSRLPAYADRQDLFSARSDPVSAVQRLLQAGRFADRGTTTIDGRKALRLVATSAGRGNRHGGRYPVTQLDYYVDAKTSVPLRFVASILPPVQDAKALSPAQRVQAHRRIPVVDLRVKRFERLPLDGAGLNLFRAPGATSRP